jgi:hypothetical protein
MTKTRTDIGGSPGILLTVVMINIMAGRAW